MIDESSWKAAADVLRIVAHPLRLRLIEMLLQRTYTVGELAGDCGVPAAIVSGHLRLMQQHAILIGTRDGRQVYYRVVEPILSCILAGFAKRAGEPGNVDCTCRGNKPMMEVVV
jgi:ArsR family transcriptional regulator, zinc-responsive transcriptional repressor